MAERRAPPRRSWTQWLDEHRAGLLFLAAYVAFAVASPQFRQPNNLVTIFKAATLNAVVAIGFTVIFILAQLDLSIGATVMLCGLLTIGLQPHLGWVGSVLVALTAAAAIGLVNGLLVVKARINSFIVTLGVSIALAGLRHLYSPRGSLQVSDYRLGDWLTEPLLPGIPPTALITLLLVLGTAFVLTHTRLGRGVFMVGGNPETAWLAGLPRDRYLMGGFIFCSLMAGLGGALKAIELSSMAAAAPLGNSTLITVIAAVIIGGTLMSGGRGGVLKSYFAVLLLTTLENGIGCFGKGFEVRMFVNGVILAGVVLYEAYAIFRHERQKGQRPDLLAELTAGKQEP